MLVTLTGQRVRKILQPHCDVFPEASFKGINHHLTLCYDHGQITQCSNTSNFLQYFLLSKFNVIFMPQCLGTGMGQWFQ